MIKMITEKFVKIKDSGSELQREVREKTLGYIITSFGLVAGLAWNDVIKAFIERFFPDPGNGLKAKFIYALIMTVFVVAISLYLSRLFKIDKKKKEKEEVVEEKKDKKSSKKK